MRVIAACTLPSRDYPMVQSSQVCAYCTETLSFSDPNQLIYFTPACTGFEDDLFSRNRKQFRNPITGNGLSHGISDCLKYFKITASTISKHNWDLERHWNKKYSNIQKQSGCPICCTCNKCQQRLNPDFHKTILPSKGDAAADEYSSEVFLDQSDDNYHNYHQNEDYDYIEHRHPTKRSSEFLNSYIDVAVSQNNNLADGDTFKYCNLIYGMFPNSNFDRTWHAGVLEECTQDSRRFVLPIVIHASSNCVIRDEWPLNTTFQIKANAYCSIIGIRLNAAAWDRRVNTTTDVQDGWALMCNCLCWGSTAGSPPHLCHYGQHIHDTLEDSSCFTVLNLSPSVK